MLMRLGLKIIDTDMITHTILDSDMIRDKLTERWGKGIIRDNKLDRKAIGDIVFNDSVELRTLNDLLHPMIIRTMKELIDDCEEQHLGFEIPLLFETGLNQYFDLNILVTALVETRIQRLISKGLNEEEAVRRIGSQMDETEKCKNADIIIQADSDLSFLEKEALRTYNLIQHSSKRDIPDLSTYHRE